MMRVRKICNIKNFILLMAGIVVSLFFTGIAVYQKVDLNHIFPQGAVYDYDKNNLTGSSATFIYDQQENCFVLSDDSASKRFRKIESEQDFHYIYFRVSHLQQETMDGILEYRDAEGNYRGCQSITFKDGDNWVYVTVPEFRFFILQVENQKNSTISFDAVQIRENAPVSKKKIAFVMCIVLIIYAGILKLCRLLHWRKMFSFAYAAETLWKLLDCFYRNMQTNLQKLLSQEFSEVRKHQIRTILFMLLFTGMQISDVMRWYADSQYYKYHIAFLGILLVIIFTISLDKNMQKTKNKEEWALRNIWLFFCLQMCISDFFVSKFYKFTGWMMLLVFGFAYYIWNQMEHPEDIIEDLARALRILFWPGLLFCLFCRQKKGAVLYNGFCRNSTTFAVYAVLMILIFLAGLYNCLLQKKDSAQRWYYGAGALISIYYLAVSGSAVCLFAGACLSFYFIFKSRKMISVNRRMVVGMCIGFLCVSAIHTGVKNIPQNTRILVEYKGETLKSWKSTQELKQLKNLDPENYKKVERKQETEYSKLWMAYLRNANLFGNKQKVVEFGGKARYPENIVVQILYRYGIIAVIPYIILLYAAGKRAVLILRRKDSITETQFIECGSILIFLITGMAVEMEEPLWLPVWVIFYLVLGRK